MTDASNTQPPIGADSPWLAPLAGFSDLPFRLLCREQGAAVACTEMVSAKGLVYGKRQKHGGGATQDLLATTPGDRPLVVQLFGAEPEFLAEAAEDLLARGFHWFDLNMGCSVPKVAKTGAGAALLRDPSRAVAAASALVRVAGSVGCKIRLGWDSPVYLDLAKALEDAGVAWITLHPRYARQGFSGTADLSALERLARRVAVPVISSGDLFSAEDAVRCLERGASGVMFARGAMGDPTIFRRYRALRGGLADSLVPDKRELLALILRHAELARALTPGKAGRKGSSPALLTMRSVVPRYARYLPGVKQLRLSLVHCRSWEELHDILGRFFGDL